MYHSEDFDGFSSDRIRVCVMSEKKIGGVDKNVIYQRKKKHFCRFGDRPAYSLWGRAFWLGPGGMDEGLGGIAFHQVGFSDPADLAGLGALEYLDLRHGQVPGGLPDP